MTALQTPGGREWTRAGGSRSCPAARSTVTYLPPRVHTTRYMTPHARARHIAHRVARSPFVTDIRAAVAAALYPLMAGSGILVAVTILVATRGQYVGWNGLHHIPTGGAR